MSSTNEMPERYRPKDHVEQRVSHHEARDRPYANMPSIVVNHWLDAEEGDRIVVAQVSTHAITLHTVAGLREVNRDTDNYLGSIAVTKDTGRSDDYQTAQLSRRYLSVMSATEDDIIRYYQRPDNTVRVQRVRASGFDPTDLDTRMFDESARDPDATAEWITGEGPRADVPAAPEAESNHKRRTIDENTEPSDEVDLSTLTDDDGNIITTRVRALNASCVSPGLCGTIRRELADSDMTAAEVAREHSLGTSTVRRHARDRCDCPTDAPPVMHLSRTWMPSDVSEDDRVPDLDDPVAKGYIGAAQGGPTTAGTDLIRWLLYHRSERVDDVADMLGVGRGTVYRHAHGKVDRPDAENPPLKHDHYAKRWYPRGDGEVSDLPPRPTEES